MELEATPDPTPEERAALEEALTAATEDAADPRGAWWREGLLENLSADLDEGQSQSS